MAQRCNIETISTKNILAITQEFYQSICHSCNQISILGYSYCIYCSKHLCNITNISKKQPITCQNCKLILQSALDNICLKLTGDYCYILCPLCNRVTEAKEMIIHLRNCPFRKSNKKRLLSMKFFNKCRFNGLNKSAFEFKLNYPTSFNRNKLHFLYQKPSRNVQIKMCHDSVKSLTGMMELALQEINFSEIELNSILLCTNEIVYQKFLNFVNKLNKKIKIIIRGEWLNYQAPLNIQYRLIEIISKKSKIELFMEKIPLNSEFLIKINEMLKNSSSNNSILSLDIDLSQVLIINNCQNIKILLKSYYVVSYDQSFSYPDKLIYKIFGICQNLIGLTLWDKLPNKELQLLLTYLKNIKLFNFLDIRHDEIELGDFTNIMNFFVDKNEITGLDLKLDSELSEYICKCHHKMDDKKSNLLRIRNLDNLLNRSNKFFSVLANSIKLKNDFKDFRLVYLRGIPNGIFSTLKELQLKKELSTYIILSNDYLDKEFSNKVQEVIENLTNLKVICLNQNLIEIENIKKIIKGIDKNQGLKIFCLTRSILSIKEFNKILEYLYTRKDTLTRLNYLNNFKITFFEFYFSKIRENPVYFKKLKKYFIKMKLDMSKYFWKYIENNFAEILNINIPKFQTDSQENKALIFKGKNLKEWNINQILTKIHEFRYDFELDLSNNNLSDSICFNISKCIISANILGSINLSENQITDIGCIIIANSILSRGSFSLLNLDKNQISHIGIKKIFVCLEKKYLKKFIGFTNNPIYTKEGLDLLISAIHLNYLENKLEVSNMNLSSEYCLLISKSLLIYTLKISILKLEKCNLDDKGLLLISNSFLSYNPFIKIINLNTNMITDIGSSYLIKLIGTIKELKEINLDYNFIHNEGCIDFANRLINCTCLEFSLSLYENQITKEGFLILIETLKKKPSIKFKGFLSTSFVKGNCIPLIPELEKFKLISKSLDLNGKGLNINILNQLALVLNKNAYFTHVNFGNNNLKSSAIKSVVSCLGSMKLVNLELDNNKLQDDCMKEIIKIIFSLNLAEINLSFNLFENSGLLLLSGALTKNCPLKKVNLENNLITSSIINQLISDIHNVKTLRFISLKFNNVHLSTEQKTNVKSICKLSQLEFHY